MSIGRQEETIPGAYTTNEGSLGQEAADHFQNSPQSKSPWRCNMGGGKTLALCTYLVKGLSPVKLARGRK